MISLWTEAVCGISSSLAWDNRLSELLNAFGSIVRRLWGVAPHQSCCLMLSSHVAIAAASLILQRPSFGSLPIPMAGTALPKLCLGKIKSWAGKKPQLHPACEKTFTDLQWVEKNWEVAHSGLRVLSSCQHHVQWGRLGGTSGHWRWFWWAEQPPQGSPGE